MRAASLARAARRRAGLSQRALAERAGVPYSTVARIETGAVDPRAGTLGRLLKVCGEQLESMPRVGAGVDRSVIRSSLALTPRQRLEANGAWVRAIARMREGLPRL